MVKPPGWNMCIVLQVAVCWQRHCYVDGAIHWDWSTITAEKMDADCSDRGEVIPCAVSCTKRMNENYDYRLLQSLRHIHLAQHHSTKLIHFSRESSINLPHITKLRTNKMHILQNFPKSSEKYRRLKNHNAKPPEYTFESSFAVK